MYRDRSLSLRDSAAQEANFAIEHARQLKDVKEHQYRVFTWISYGLYTLGWGLGLVGHLFGSKTPFEV
jgi:hypothetical protein